VLVQAQDADDYRAVATICDPSDFKRAALLAVFDATTA